MRWVLLIFALLLLPHCSGTGVTDYNDPDNQPRSSLEGDQGGAGVQAPIWSDDPNKQTIINQKPSQ